MAKVLLDSTFLLPTLGVIVEDISDDELKLMAKLKDRVEYYCINRSLVEVLGKVARSLVRDTRVLGIIELGLRSLLESETYKWINPTVQAFLKALELRAKGHRDMIDNMLYATALTDKMYFLSKDDALLRFLKTNHYDTNFIVQVKELVKKLDQERKGWGHGGFPIFT